MSVATSPPPGGATPAAGAPARVPAAEACPLCGAPLHPDQEWCLNCGAAARTRLAASPSWKGLIVALAVVVALALGVLAAALVSLAGGSSTTPAITRTVTTAAALTPTTATTAATATIPSTHGVGGKSVTGATGATGPSTTSTKAASSVAPAGTASSDTRTSAAAAGSSTRPVLSQRVKEALRKLRQSGAPAVGK